MKKGALLAGLAAIVVFGLALRVGAQGPPPPGEFGRRGPGPGAPGGLGGPIGGVGRCTANCTPYQFTYTRTSTQPVLVDGKPSTISNTTTGTIARDSNGSTYRDVKVSAIGPWASETGPQEFIYIRNLDPSIMTQYIVNVTKKTYEQFPIHPSTPPASGNPNPNWLGERRKNGDASSAGSRSGVTRTQTSYTLRGYNCAAAEQTTIRHTIQLPGPVSATITTNRVYCTDLQLVVEEDHSDPRFGTSTYQLSGYSSPSPALFTPPSGYKLIEGQKFGRGLRDDGKGPTPPSP